MSKFSLHIGRETMGLRDYEEFACPEDSKSRVTKSKDIAVIF